MFSFPIRLQSVTFQNSWTPANKGGGRETQRKMKRNWSEEEEKRGWGEERRKKKGGVVADFSPEGKNRQRNP